MTRLPLIATIAALLLTPQLVLAKSRTVALNVPTMDCATCPITIKAALTKVTGVSSAKVSYQRREAVVVFDDSKTDVDALKKATSDAGYPSFLKTASD
ncbi:mercury resistance system periplasmic binding protein MerP [Oxalobacteraceae bacterium OM1]|nr:mercury resistance system periplasmic binding protein MerP [Oxalobacteraceae bacterium OM1]